MIHDANIPDRLIELQTAADDERAKLKGLAEDEHEARWKRWFDAAATVQAAVTDHATDTGLNRTELESAVKKAIRHPDPG